MATIYLQEIEGRAAEGAHKKKQHTFLNFSPSPRGPRSAVARCVTVVLREVYQRF